LFATKHSDENIRTVAAFMMVVYDAHITINERMSELLKKLDKTDQGELMDSISPGLTVRSGHIGNRLGSTPLMGAPRL
jgi:hypothetical protein